MRGVFLIRTILAWARRHGGDAALMVFFLGLLVTSLPSLLSGAGKAVEAFTPDRPIHAAPKPHDRARLALFGFHSAAAHGPQILFPVKHHAWPKWLAQGAQALRQGPVIAICIDDLGEDLAATHKAMALPRNVTLAFLPFADATPFLAREAEAKGHEVLAHVPMEALGGADPGPMALKVGAPDNLPRLSWNIARVPGLSGINNHEGSKFTADAASLVPVARFLAARHLFFFDSRTIGDSKVVAVARKEGVMSASRDIFLDDEVTPAAIRRQLADLAADAKRDGVALAIGHPHGATLDILARWLAQGHGVKLVPVSQAIRIKTALAAAN